MKVEPEQMIYDLENCTGPCGRLCINCPQGHYLDIIKETIQDLMDERDKYRKMCEERFGIE